MKLRKRKASLEEDIELLDELLTVSNRKGLINGNGTSAGALTLHNSYGLVNGNGLTNGNNFPRESQHFSTGS
ncbi:MAG: hypothetical protein KAJ51_09515, partial [Thermoplasmata archaeon]|nr:hypothetical protein [Thermoplasmata archaeon]